MLRWPYIWNPPLDHVDFWIYCYSHTPLLNDRRDLKAHNPFDINHHRKFPGKQRKYTCREGLVAGQFSLFHRWIMLIFGYVVRLDAAFILDGEDQKCILQQGVVHVEQQLVYFQVSLVVFRSMKIQPLDHSEIQIYCTQLHYLYSDCWVQANSQRWMTYYFLNLLLVLVKIQKA